MKLKNNFLKIAIAGALLGSSANALADTSFVVEIDNPSLKDTASWVTGYRQLSSDYAKVTVKDEDASFAENFFYDNGYVFSEDITFSKPKQETEPRDYSSLVTQQDESLNDPMLSGQTSLLDSSYKILEGMLYKRETNKKPVVLLLDSGSLPHEDVVFSGGYNYADTYLDPSRDPADYSDLTTIINDDGSIFDTCYDGHGINMAGIISASKDNKVGIAGISSSKMYMARVLEKDCASGESHSNLSNIIEALSDANNASNKMGAPSFDVVNMSLAAKGVCTEPLQKVINDLYNAGTVVVTSVGNQGELASAYTPGNCENVINVGAIDEGSYPSYGNTGSEVDILAPSYNLTTTIENRYENVIGTSGAAAVVTGMVALIKEQFPDATPEEVSKVLEISSNPLEFDFCGDGCGSGSVNLKEAIVASEKIIDPEITFSHAFGDSGQCLVVREAEALSSQFNVCGAMVGKVNSSYVEEEEPVIYELEVMKRPLGVTNWTSSRVQKIYDYSPTMNQDELPIQDADFSQYDYGISSCYISPAGEKFCPYVEKLESSEIVLPSGC